ncbi:MAG TPA: mannonate dehydratase [Gemmataceae bacterium]|jgi:mannonate dehydratase|nr:mannonate dehydratase [Gemmataceae bacterium]
MKTTRRTFLLSSAATWAATGDRAPAAARSRAWVPKLSENLADVAPATLRWLRQLGCRHVVFQGTDGVDADHKGYWTTADVRHARKRCEEAGLVLESMMIPIDFYRQARLGRPGRDKEIDNVCRTIRAAGAEGVPMLEWRFWPDFFWDARVGYHATPGRGGARLRAFDYDRVKDAPPFADIGVVGNKEMWARFLYFAKPIVAAAEKADVRLTMHPNDPPVPVMRGVARIFHHPDGLRRFLKEVPSKASGITFCQGTIAEMGVNVLEEIRAFGRRGQIFLVHFRFVRGKVPRYTEVFMDEGDLDPLQAMRAYRDVGYGGPIVSDHTPRVEGDTPWGHRGRTYSHGYMRALVHAVNAR